MPVEYEHLDTRGNVKLSTKIKVATDRTGTKASRIAARMNETLESYWRGLADKKTAEAKQSYLDAVKLARSLGLDYQTPSVGASAPVEEVLRRIETLILGGTIDNPALSRAAMGAVERSRRSCCPSSSTSTRSARSSPCRGCRRIRFGSGRLPRSARWQS
ncbi:hypothetical protein [Bradyrhizobium sp. LB12.1]|uniref:hypothetical protein n=1 Tax=Bradyrhizobium sp. LB12.1 TaxID=3156327 RepID=UPI003393ACE4